MASNHDSLLHLGTVVHERYRIQEVVGRGSSGGGAVYQVNDILFGRNNDYALKELSTSDDSARKQFTQEAQWLQALDHPAVPKVREAFEWKGRLYLVLDYINGENLEQKIQRGGGQPLPLRLALNYMMPVFDALQYLHTRVPPLLHLDVKPANIIVSVTSHIVLVDLGTGTEYFPGLEMKRYTTKLVADEGYAPLEQYTAAGRVGPWSDVYGAGATLYALLTGTTPSTAVERATAIDTLKPLRQLNRELEPGVEAAILHAMAIRPEDRWPSISTFIAGLTGRGPSAPHVVHRQPRVFVSHSHHDIEFCREYVRGLKSQGVDVWYDEHNLGWGALRRAIEDEMARREHFVAILSPEAVNSEWVNAEIDGALELLREKRLQTFILVVAAPCTVPLLLRSYKRVERPGGGALSVEEAVSRTRNLLGDS